MSLEQADAHQRKHGFKPLLERFIKGGQQAQKEIDELTHRRKRSRSRKPREMNKTEREFSMILEARRRQGEISRWIFEGVTLRWMVGDELIRYTPDFTVFNYAPFEHETKFIEVKGPYITGKMARAVERFRHAKTFWSEFEFELWQKKESKWTHLL